MKGFEYFAPGSLEEALKLLDDRGKEATALAGGTDLIVQMKEGQKRPAAIVDVKHIPELNRLEYNGDGSLHIGAAVPLSKILALPQLMEDFSMLHQACSLIGSVQIKNRGTIGGNVCNAAPSADSPPPLICLGAQATIARLGKTRVVPMENFFEGPGETVLADNELLLELEIPAPPADSAGCYLRLTPREEMDIGVVGAASFLVFSEQDGQCREARIALAAVAPTPIRVPQAESVLEGKVLTEEMITEAADKAAEEAHPISDMRASAEYRRNMVKVLTRRTLTAAWKSLDRRD